MKRAAFVVAFLLSLSLPYTAKADSYANVKVDKLLVSSTTYTGQKLTYNDTADPEVTALIVHFPPGGSTGWHKHPIPVYAYILDGELTINMKDGSSYHFKKGEVVLEVMNTLHNGVNTGDRETTLMVFYSGTTGMPNVIKENVSDTAATPKNTKDQTLPKP
ncbi:MAG: cupin domain-containing protein [Chlorobiaceae bacterium]|nr:cupin domain-containing protein [Chlorobiaceae bacterium]